MRYVLCKYFLPVHGLSSHSLLDNVFCRAEVFNFNKAQRINYFFRGVCVFGVMSKELFATLKVIQVFPLWPSRSFSRYFTLQPLIRSSFTFRIFVHFPMMVSGGQAEDDLLAVSFFIFSKFSAGDICYFHTQGKNKYIPLKRRPSYRSFNLKFSSADSLLSFLFVKGPPEWRVWAALQHLPQTAENEDGVPHQSESFQQFFGQPCQPPSQTTLPRPGLSRLLTPGWAFFGLFFGRAWSRLQQQLLSWGTSTSLVEHRP